MTGLGTPKLAHHLNPPEPRPTLAVGGKPVEFLVDTDATYLVLITSSGKLGPKIVILTGYQGRPKNGHS